jgi:hypothetical protein
MGEKINKCAVMVCLYGGVFSFVFHQLFLCR